jgi:SAM-dependent methyltransferase
VDTRGVVHAAQMNGCGNNWVHGAQYQPSNPQEFQRLFSAAPIRHEQYIFIDVGSGKGRALVLAARYPFKRMVGIEYSKELHAIAERNVVTAGLSGRIELVCCDALDYSLPAEPLVIFLYNPFDGAIMRPFVANVEHSLRQNPRPMWVLYSNAVHPQAWDESTLFRRVAEGHEGEAFVVWQNVEMA